MLWSKAIGAAGAGGAGEGGKTTAFISANYSASLVAVDISDPTAMTSISSLTVSAQYLTYSPELGIVFATNVGTGKVSAVDVSNPANMTVLGDMTVSGAAQCVVDALGGVLYVASGTNLVSIDISNLAAMVQLSSLNTSSTINGMELLSDKATIYTSYNAYMKKIDVSNPASMSVSSSTYLTSSYRNLGGVLINANETHIFGAMSNADNVMAMDVATDQIYTASPSANSNSAEDIAYDEIDNVLYVTGPSSYGFSSVDVSDPTSPAALSQVNDSTLYYSGDTYGPIATDSTNKLLFLTSAIRDRITVFDVSNPASPVVISHITTITNPLGIVLA